MKEHEARKHDFKRSDLAFYVERFQILLDVINLDLAGNLQGVEDANYHAASLWDRCRDEHYGDARRILEFFYGYVWVIPKSHRNSYRNYLTEVNNAL